MPPPTSSHCGSRNLRMCTETSSSFISDSSSGLAASVAWTMKERIWWRPTLTGAGEFVQAMNGARRRQHGGDEGRLHPPGRQAVTLSHPTPRLLLLFPLSLSPSIFSLSSSLSPADRIKRHCPCPLLVGRRCRRGSSDPVVEEMRGRGQLTREDGGGGRGSERGG